MGSEAEPAKMLLPYLQRADELQKHEPLVAYYCRLYAMEKGLRIPQKERTKTTNSILVSLINQLEKDKKSIKLGPEDNLYVEGFASNVFAKADKQDRAGRADLNTAKTFYAASIFFEVLNQFNEVQPDIEQRQKYAIWKAADIRKALKEGRRPEPGPPGDDKDVPVPSSSSAYELGRSESISASQPGGASPLGPDTSSGHHVKDLGRNESFPASYSGADFPASQPGGVSPLGPDTSSGHHVKDLGRNESFPASYSGADFPTPHVDNVDPHGYTQAHLSPSSYSTTDYPSSTFPQPHAAANPPPNHQQYPSDQHSLPQTYHPPENPIPPYTYPNFQTYPSFQDSTLPTPPSHQPYYNGPEMPYSHQSAPPASDYPSTKHYDSGSRNDSFSRNMNHGESSAPPAATYAHDPNYMPPVEKITEAHKAARFAVGALAFDDVPVAVEFLRRSLELLTNPSAESH